ncbi:hypothetical protein [Burkholderia phage BCSR52]|uniref:Lipoprotein n=1 Tax=Burkholderia phage BCSR52 TaxID=2805748 RepID=A0A889IQD7_9CAUD|nr:hypothetical protein [Burkholderia phage BCSR52]
MKFVDTPESKRSKTNYVALFFAFICALAFACAGVKIAGNDFHAASFFAGIGIFSGAFHAIAVMIFGKSGR